MTAIVALWRDGRLPAEDGLFFAEGQSFVVDDIKEFGLAELLAEDSDWVTSIDIAREVESNPFSEIKLDFCTRFRALVSCSGPTPPLGGGAAAHVLRPGAPSAAIHRRAGQARTRMEVAADPRPERISAAAPTGPSSWTGW
ncbi:hypothetical protein [Actinokineospora xionganensis]|uniref:Uncharacterized protein n=1 Tax=Actinokineospora xionganensis TaxID=2684470 RepID=A0ABR7L5C3_9PSEU|nr:hypothetical protein [Actinokineospora xionganensis]MBC6447887.1 hypothetical protein [Actinokineospora xionganensis]